MIKVDSNGSFEQIIEANKASIYRVCRTYAESPIEPEDLFQEVVYHIWKSLDSYNGSAQISTWIYRITINVCVRYKLKLDKHNNKTTRLSAIKILPAAESKDEVQEERFAILRTCIRALKEAERSLIVLYLEGLAYKEIAEVTGLTENHVAVKMKRIRKTLFDCISLKLK